MLTTLPPFQGRPSSRCGLDSDFVADRGGNSLGAAKHRQLVRSLAAISTADSLRTSGVVIRPEAFLQWTSVTMEEA